MLRYLQQLERLSRSPMTRIIFIKTEVGDLIVDRQAVWLW